MRGPVDLHGRARRYAAIGGMTLLSVFIVPAAIAQNPRAAGPPDDRGCTISVIGMEFGSYDGNNPAPLDGYSSTTINCRPLPGEGQIREAIITISKGSSPQFIPRQMMGPGGTLDYNLYMDATRQTVWGDGSGGTEFLFVNNPQPNRDITFTIYGRVDPLQAVSAGRYQDSLTVTIFF